MEPTIPQLRAFVIGSTGASGREVVKALMDSNKWKEVTVIVRRSLPQWETYDKSKLKVIEVKSLDELAETSKWTKTFENYDSFFSCLGARSNAPKDELYKIEYTYAYNSGVIAKNAGVKHCSYIGGEGMKKDSWLYHAKVKAQVSEALENLKFNVYSKFNPGLLLDRDNDYRFFEKFHRFIPFLPKIKTSELGAAMVLEAEKIHLNLDPQNNITKTYNNKQIKQFLEEKK